MRNGVFVTGGTGFVGRRLRAAIGDLGRPVWWLARTGSQGSTGSVTVVPGDVLRPADYVDALRSCDTVVHMAAATGRASAAEHDRVNAQGTAVLLEACRQAGVSRFVFVSSIATAFPDLTAYHYAVAKKKAEEAVARSGLRFAIVRPTIILGPGAPILQSLEKLALLPVSVVPGNGRCRVQPIHVDDVVRCLLELARRDDLDGGTYEIGGPEVLSMEELLRRLRAARTGRRGPVVHLPLPLLQWPLRLAESAGLVRLLPITAGQLTSFRFDGVAAQNALSAQVADSLKNVDSMISSGGARQEASVIDRECRTFSRHLLRLEPDDYVAARYRAAVETLPALAASLPMDGTLLSFARRGAGFARIADAYASLLAKDSALRKRLVVLLAIFETRPPYSDAIDRAPDVSPVLALARLALHGAVAGFAFVAGACVFVPVRVVQAVTGKTGR